MRERSAYLDEALSTFPNKEDHWAILWTRATGNFDPWPYWERTKKPVLFFYGGKDENVDTQASQLRMWKEGGAGKERLTVVHFEGNGHALYRDDALDMIRRWILDLGAD